MNTAGMNTNTADALAAGWKITGNPDCWELVCKATSPDGIEKSTKRMKVPGGSIYAVSTRIGVNAAGEALVFVPDPFTIEVAPRPASSGLDDDELRNLLERAGAADAVGRLLGLDSSAGAVDIVNAVAEEVKRRPSAARVKALAAVEAINNAGEPLGRVLPGIMLNVLEPFFMVEPIGTPAEEATAAFECIMIAAIQNGRAPRSKEDETQVKAGLAAFFGVPVEVVGVKPKTKSTRKKPGTVRVTVPMDDDDNDRGNVLPSVS